MELDHILRLMQMYQSMHTNYSTKIFTAIFVYYLML